MILILSFAMIVVFQNCSQVNFLSLDTVKNDFKSLGNGEGYGGKPDYYRLVPDFTCESIVSPAAFLRMVGPVTTLVENRKLACGAASRDLDSALVDTSIYQHDIVGFQEGIFEGSDTAPQSIPANLVEVWCRDTKDEKGIETITHFNRLTGKANTRIYYSQNFRSINQFQKTPDFNSPRLLESTRVTVEDANGGVDFHLVVYRDQPAINQFGLFNGHLDTKIDEVQLHRETYCRLGGTLDPKLWPVAQIVDSNIYQLKFSPDENSFTFSSRTGSKTNGWNLFSSDYLGNGQKQISSNMQSSGVSLFTYTPDSKSIVFWGDPISNGQLNLLKVNSDGSGEINLSPKAFGNRMRMDIQLTSDGQRVIYNPMYLTYNTLESALESISINGGQVSTLNPPIEPMAFNGVFDFAVSKSTNRVAFLAGAHANLQLYIADADGNNRVKPPLALPDSSWAIRSYVNDNMIAPEAGNYVIVHANKISNGSGSDIDYAVSIDGVQVLQLASLWSASSPDGLTFLTHDPSSGFAIFDVQKKVSMPLSMLSPLFSKDSLSVIGTKAFSATEFEPSLVTLANGEESPLCTAAHGTSLKILETARNQFLIVSLNKISSNLSVFMKEQNSPCSLKNSFPLSHSLAVETLIIHSSLSPDQSKALVQLRLKKGFESHDQIFYVPLNNQPAILVNTPVYWGALIDQAQFLKDSAGIFYSGTQINQSDHNAYVWRAP